MTVQALFHHVSIPRPLGTESQQKARAFYGGLLELREIPVPHTLAHLDLVWYAVGTQELHLFGEEPRHDDSGRHFCMQVSDQATLRMRLIAAGVPCSDTTPIPDRPRFFCTDPFGNMIEITTIIAQ
ncbi:MAG: VOC family protein [Roseiflexaceae bacterium]